MIAANASLWALAPVGVLLILSNALLVASELALLRVCLSHFEPLLAEKLREEPAIKKLIENAEGTARLLRTSSFLGAGCYALLLFRMAQVAFWRAGGAHAGAFLASALILFAGTGLFLFFGILLPRVAGLRHPGTVLRIAGRSLFLYAPLDYAVVRPMRIIISAFMRRMGVKDVPGLESLGFEEQIEHPGEGVEPMSAMARRIFRNALEMRGLVLSDVLLPRHQVQWMDLNDSVEENLRLARETGHTRFPLCIGDLDRCVGLIHIKDVFRRGTGPRGLDLRRLKRDILRLAPETSVEEAMHTLLSGRQHLALVVDEFRGAEGIVTLERLLELLVGDIRDEFDVEEDNIRRMPNGDYSVSGLAPVYEVERALDLEFRNEEVSTFGGQITAELGRIPAQGERLKLDGLDIVVTEVDERRVIRARVRPLPPVAEEE
jgi:CBS domain containing-hemolysin-like protein